MTITKIQAVLVVVTLIAAAFAGLVCILAFIGTHEVQFALTAAALVGSVAAGLHVIRNADIQ